MRGPQFVLSRVWLVDSKFTLLEMHINKLKPQRLQRMAEKQESTRNPPPRKYAVGCMEFDYKGLPARALFLAVNRRNIDELKRLLAGPAAKMVNDLDGDKFGLLHTVALKKAPAAMVPIIVEAGGNVDLRNGDLKETPLIIAAAYGAEEVAKSLLAHGARADAADWCVPLLRGFIAAVFLFW
jgi:hypothetical protein